MQMTRKHAKRAARRLAEQVESVDVPEPRKAVRQVRERIPGMRRRSRMSWMRPALPFAMAAGVGAVVAFFFDPQQGTRRRKVGADRLAGAVRRSGRRSSRMGRGAAAHLRGWSRKALHAINGEHRPVTDDGQLLARVESMVFRDPSVPKGRLNINVENGVVVLRGELDEPEEIRDFEQRVRRVPGVFEVENLMHVTGTPAPNKAAAVRA
jgi:hypothetical protein